ncbi:MAG TPA: hypothetical protein VJ719_13320 [Chthoniobacterales bacterium]|nr:hypothetical protein [Chthoniobacterales bacterium]
MTKPECRMTKEFTEQRPNAQPPGCLDTVIFSTFVIRISLFP